MADERFVGRWRLVSFVGLGTDGSMTQPFGADAQGSLVYGSDGWMSAQVCAGERPPFAGSDLRGQDDDERAAAFSSYIAYCGSYEVTGDVVVHRVAMSLIPNLAGSEQVRQFELSGDDLVLRTPPMEISGAVRVNELRWRRERT